MMSFVALGVESIGHTQIATQNVIMTFLKKPTHPALEMSCVAT